MTGKTVTAENGVATCPYCDRAVRVSENKYGACVLESCRHYRGLHEREVVTTRTICVDFEPDG